MQRFTFDMLRFDAHSLMNTTTTPRSPAPIPAAAWLLGGAGLIPFAAPTVLAFLGHAQYLVAQRSYAACVLAFLGALHWAPALNGTAQKPTVLLMWGVVPSLWAWAALQLPVGLQALALLAGLVVAMMADLLLAPVHRWGAGYLAMRTLLTTVASLSLLGSYLLR
jgi:Protein of unknown function (DUF3429)